MQAKAKLFPKAIFVRVSVDDATAIERAARRLNLRIAEVVRRSIRTGLSELDRIDLPGARLENSGIRYDE